MFFPWSRLNNAPVAGYEGDVGSKTTIRLFYPESAHFDPKMENNPDTLLVLVAFKAMDFHWIETILSDKKRVNWDRWGRERWLWGCYPCQGFVSHRVPCDDLKELVRGQPEPWASRQGHCFIGQLISCPALWLKSL